MPVRIPRLASFRIPLQNAAPKAVTRTFITSTRLNANSNKSIKSSVASFSTSSIVKADVMTAGANAVQDIDPSALEIELTTSPKAIPLSSTLTFGRTFTDHMLCIPWSSESGWGTPKISPYGPLALDPASTVLHYAPCLFEGMKAYKDEKGVARLFRPDKNMERMTRSAARLAFPSFTGENLNILIKKLVEVDSAWIPTDVNTSLYIRPTMIGTQAGLGVGPSTEVLLFVIMSPVGPYYKTGFKPIKLLATTTDVRAWPGGTGGYKLGSNYTAGVLPQQKAAALGFQQILWLYGPEHMLTEVGTMNLFAAFKKSDGSVELVTPPLEDMILPGVTRDSILSLARAHADPNNPKKIEGLPDNLIISERNMNMADIIKGSADGTLLEMFGSGTAAIVSCVDGVGYKDEIIPVHCGEDGLGDIARVMLREIVGRQTGTIKSSWSQTVI